MRHSCPGCFGLQSRISNWRALGKVASPRLGGCVMLDIEGKFRPYPSINPASRLVVFTIGVLEGVSSPPTTTNYQKTLSLNFLTIH
jgi:hypothetical protein